MSAYPYAVVWMTTPYSGTPHAVSLQAANPGLDIRVCNSVHGRTQEERYQRWRNCDRNIRSWWRINRADVEADSILFLEWDVFCDVDLRSVIPPRPPGVGIAGAEIMSGLADARRFWPFADIPRLPREMHAIACATAPLAVLLISRAALDAILAPAYDAVFAADLFCELRLPTVIRHAGFGVAALDLPGVTATPAVPTEHGIFHPVKHPVPPLP
jgi:hypothetical protein